MSVDVVAARYATSIRRVAEKAHTEEDLRIGVERVLQSALRDLGVDVAPRYEKGYGGSVLAGRPDAVYGHAVIEYERVGVLSHQSGVDHAAEQLERYLVAEAGGDISSAGLRRAVGIGLDGQRIFFLRFRSPVGGFGDTLQPSRQRVLPFFPDGEDAPEQVAVGSFQRLGPYPVTEKSVQEMLLYLRALRRRPLTPEALADEFGPGGDIARRLVATFYDALRCSSHPKVQTFFKEWDRLFGIVYGQDTVRAKKDARALAETYGLAQYHELKPLLFAVHTYYALLMKMLASELPRSRAGLSCHRLLLICPHFRARRSTSN